MDYLIQPRTRGVAGPLPSPLVTIESGGDFTLTEAAQFALAILATVQDYGTVAVEAKT